MKILDWKHDKEDIQYTIGRMNPKYLIGLYLKAKKSAHSVVHKYMEADGTDYETAKDTAFKTVRESVHYDGVTFQMSLKTIKDELNRRIEIGQIICDPTATTNKTRYTVNKSYNK